MNTQRAFGGNRAGDMGEGATMEAPGLFDEIQYTASPLKRLGEAALQTQEAGRNSQSTHKVPLEINHARVEAV